jgi:hypothetical protein
MHITLGLREILDVMSEPSVQAVYVRSALIGALATALVLYHRALDDQPPRQGVVRVLAAGIILAGWGLLIVNENQGIEVAAQAAASSAVVVLVLLPLHRLFAPFRRDCYTSLWAASRLHTLWSTLRFALVTLVFIVMACGIALYAADLHGFYDLFGHRGNQVLFHNHFPLLMPHVYVDLILGIFSHPLFYALLAACAGVAFILYHPPERSYAPRYYLRLRVLGVIVCATALVFAYSQTTPNTESDFVRFIALAIAATVALMPVHRVYS